MAITSETLKNSIVETIKAKGAEGGFLSALGATQSGMVQTHLGCKPWVVLLLL